MKSILFVVGVFLAGACTEGRPYEPGSKEINVNLVAGQIVNGLLGVTIEELDFNATDELGEPVSNLTITWSIVGPSQCRPNCGAAVAPLQTVTNASGQASVDVTLGTTNGEYLLIPLVPSATGVDTVKMLAGEPL